MFILKEGKKVYDQIPAVENTPTLFKLPKTASDYAYLGFFRN
jgi:hypothetical protein